MYFHIEFPNFLYLLLAIIFSFFTILKLNHRVYLLQALQKFERLSSSLYISTIIDIFFLTSQINIYFYAKMFLIYIKFIFTKHISQCPFPWIFYIVFAKIFNYKFSKFSNAIVRISVWSEYSCINKIFSG